MYASLSILLQIPSLAEETIVLEVPLSFMEKLSKPQIQLIIFKTFSLLFSMWQHKGKSIIKENMWELFLQYELKSYNKNS